MTKTALPPLDGAVALSHCGVIRAQGADAATFLHGQLTNDFVQLDSSQARLAGYCSAKGRLLASFLGWKSAPDDILLVCSADLLAATLKRLSMFVMRAKCRLADASAELQLMGLTGPRSVAWLGQNAPAEVGQKASAGAATVVRLADAAGQARFLWVAPTDTAAPPLPVLELETWRWAEVQSAVPRIEAATADQFVPQMVNFELLGGVDFKKGCYPGQEVVARSQYRGTLKRRSLLFSVDAAAAPGQEVFHSDDPGQPAGMVVNAARHSSAAVEGSVLAEVKIASLDSGSLHLGSPEGPLLSPVPMPYDISRLDID